MLWRAASPVVSLQATHEHVCQWYNIGVTGIHAALLVTVLALGFRSAGEDTTETYLIVEKHVRFRRVVVDLSKEGIDTKGAVECEPREFSERFEFR